MRFDIRDSGQVKARINRDFEIKQKFAPLRTGEAGRIRGNLLVMKSTLDEALRGLLERAEEEKQQ